MTPVYFSTSKPSVNLPLFKELFKNVLTVRCSDRCSDNSLGYIPGEVYFNLFDKIKVKIKFLKSGFKPNGFKY